MDDYLPSEVARLVLGYLKEVNCMKSWNTFLEESPSLREYYLLYNNGKIYGTKVDEKSLSEILSFYRSLKKYGEKIVNEIKRYEKEYSSDPDTIKGILEEIVNMVSLAFQKYFSSNNEKKIMRTPTLDGTVDIIYSESKEKINDLSENVETNCGTVIHENNDKTLPNISAVYSLSNVNSSSLPFLQNLIDFNIPAVESLKDEYLESNKISNMEKSDGNLKDSRSAMNNESQVYYVTNKGSFVNNNNSINNHLLENCGDNFITVPGNCASIEAKTTPPDTEMSPKKISENINKLEVPILSNCYNVASSDEMVTKLNNENHLVKENIGCFNDNSSQKSLSCKNSEINANNNLEFNRLSYNNQDIFGGIINYENKLGCLNNEIDPPIAFNAHQLATMNTLPISTIPTYVLAGDILMQSTIPYNYVMNTSCSGLAASYLPIADTSSNILNMNATTTDTLKCGETMLTLSTPFLGNILTLPNGQSITSNTIGEKDFKKADESSVKISKKKKDKKSAYKNKKIKSNELKSSEECNFSKCTSKRKFLCLLPCTPEKKKEVAVTTTSVCNTAISDVAASALKLFSLITGQNEDCNRPVSTAEHEIKNESQVISTKNKSINEIDKSKGDVQSYYQKGNLNKSDTLKSNNKSKKSEKQTIRNVNDVANNDLLANNKLKCNVSFRNHQTRDINQSQASYSKVESQENTMVQFNDKIKTYCKQKKDPQNSKKVNSLKPQINKKQTQLNKKQSEFKKILPKINEGITQDNSDVTSQNKKNCTMSKTKLQEENIVNENASPSICKNDFLKKGSLREIAIYSIKENSKNSKLKKSLSKDQSKSDVNNKHLKKNIKYESLITFCKSRNSTIQAEKKQNKHSSFNLSSDLNSVLEDQSSKTVFHTTEEDCSLKQTETSEIKEIPTDQKSTRLSTVVNSAESLSQNEFDNASNKCLLGIFTSHNADVVTQTESMIQNLNQNYPTLICDDEKSKFENVSHIVETEKENDTSKTYVWHSTPSTFFQNKKTARKIKLSKYSKTKNRNKNVFARSLIINKPVSSYSSPSSDDRNSKIITNPPNLCQAIKSHSFHNSAENFPVSDDNQCCNHADTCDVSENFSNINQDVIYNDNGKKRKLSNSCDIDDRLELNVSDNQFSNCSSLSIAKKSNCNESDNKFTDNKLQSVPYVMLTKLDEHKMHSLTHTVDQNEKEKYSDNKNNVEEVSKTNSEENKQMLSQSSNESIFSCSLKLSIQNFTNICDSNLKDTVDTNEEKVGEKANENCLAFTSCEKQLVISQSSNDSHSSKNVCSNDIADSSEKEMFENPTVSSKKEVKTAIKVSSFQWDIVQNAIEKYGYDYILSKVREYVPC